MLKRFFSIIITIFLAIEIFYFSSLPGTISTGGSSLIPIAYHFIVFFLLTFFIFQSIKSKNKIKPNQIIMTILISILYAISDEIHQLFVPLRHGGIFDILIDSLGIFCAVLIVLYIKKQTKPQQQPLSHLLFSGEEYENEHD